MQGSVAYGDLALLPQGRAEATARVQNMVATMDEAGFGNCTNEYECEAVCPKEISTSNIAFLNREYIRNLVSLSSLRPLVTSE